MNIPEGISKITSKKYATSDVVPAKPIASITARTLPPKIKEDLRLIWVNIWKIMDLKSIKNWTLFMN